MDSIPRPISFSVEPETPTQSTPPALPPISPLAHPNDDDDDGDTKKWRDSESIMTDVDLSLSATSEKGELTDDVDEIDLNDQSTRRSVVDFQELRLDGKKLNGLLEEEKVRRAAVGVQEDGGSLKVEGGELLVARDRASYKDEDDLLKKLEEQYVLPFFLSRSLPPAHQLEPVPHVNS